MNIQDADFVGAVLEYEDSNNTNPRSGSHGLCRYTMQGLHCLIGQVLADLGMDQHELDAQEGYGAWYVMTRVCASSDDVVDAADELQTRADDGITWAEAIAGSDKFDELREKCGR